MSERPDDGMTPQRMLLAAAAVAIVVGLLTVSLGWFTNVGLVLVTFAVGRRWYGDPVGLLAGAIIATSFGAFYMARQALPDLPLAFFMTVATWAAIEAIVRSVVSSRLLASAIRSRVWYSSTP